MLTRKRKKYMQLRSWKPHRVECTWFFSPTSTTPPTPASSPIVFLFDLVSVLPTILDKINGKPWPPPPFPPNQRWENGAFFALRAASSLIWGGWGFAVPFYFVQDCNLGQNKWKTLTPPPNQRWEDGAFLPFARLHPWFGGDGGLLFHFILSKIVVTVMRFPRPSRSSYFSEDHVTRNALAA